MTERKTNLCENLVLKKLRNDEVVLSMSVTPIASPKIAELIGLIGYDAVWIDMEHQDYDYESVFNVSLACRSKGIVPLIRIRRSGRHSCFRAFEAGATGLMVPHCMGCEDARSIVRDSRFFPKGLRGLDGVEANADYGMASPAEYMEWANRETFVMVQIEDKEALEEIDEIAAIDGIDILFVGPADLSQSLGVPLNNGHSLMKEAFEKVADAAKRHGKWWGAPGGNLERAQELVELGARFINCGSALGVMKKGFAESFQTFSQLQVPKEIAAPQGNGIRTKK